MEVKDFLTIRKQFYNHFLGAMSEKVVRFYNKQYLPPTIWYTLDHLNCKVLPSVAPTLWLIQNELPEDVKIKFSENIAIQEKVIERIKDRNEKSHYRCWLIKLTTWKGKSHVIMDIAEYYQTPTLILVHNVKTLWEMVEKFKNFTNITPTQYGGWKKNLSNITIMTKKSFALDYDKIDINFWLVLIDEAPIWFQKNFWQALNIFFHRKEWIALYWLSGTPQSITLDQCDLEVYFWKTIEISWQANNWYNIIPSFEMYDYVNTSRYEFENTAEMRTAIWDDHIRFDKQCEILPKLIDSWNCLLILSDRKFEVDRFYNSLQHWGIFYNNFLNRMSHDTLVFTMTWDTKNKDDDENILEAKRMIKLWKKVIIIWTIQKIGVGVDIPFIDTIFLASAIKFRSTVIQAIGRALRKFEGKDSVLVWIWNDIPILNKQKIEKIKTITTEYGINKKDILVIKV